MYPRIHFRIFRPFPVLASSVKFFQPHPRLETQKSRYTREPSGSRMLLTRKSSRSRIAPPNTLSQSQDHTLYPSTHGRDRRMMAMAFTRLDFFRLQPVSSIPQEIIFSNTARMVEKAANDIKMKNRLPHSLPSGMWLKIFGSVMKIRLGPEVWSTLNVKHAGKIISPEVIATKVSRSAIFMDSPSSA